MDKYYVYFLLSLANGDLYVGSTQDVKIRLTQHNNGRVKSTKPYRPWKLLGDESFPSRSEAVKMEKFFKTHQQKGLLRKKFGLTGHVTLVSPDKQVARSVIASRDLAKPDKTSIRGCLAKPDRDLHARVVEWYTRRT